MTRVEVVTELDVIGVQCHSPEAEVGMGEVLEPTDAARNSNFSVIPDRHCLATLIYRLPSSVDSLLGSSWFAKRLQRRNKCHR